MFPFPTGEHVGVDTKVGRGFGDAFGLPAEKLLDAKRSFLSARLSQSWTLLRAQVRHTTQIKFPPNYMHMVNAW